MFTGWWLVETKLIKSGNHWQPVAAFILRDDAITFIDNDETNGAYKYRMKQLNA